MYSWSGCRPQWLVITVVGSDSRASSQQLWLSHRRLKRLWTQHCRRIYDHIGGGATALALFPPLQPPWPVRLRMASPIEIRFNKKENTVITIVANYRGSQRLNERLYCHDNVCNSVSNSAQ